MELNVNYVLDRIRERILTLTENPNLISDEVMKHHWDEIKKNPELTQGIVEKVLQEKTNQITQDEIVRFKDRLIEGETFPLDSMSFEKH